MMMDLSVTPRKIWVISGVFPDPVFFNNMPHYQYSQAWSLVSLSGYCSFAFLRWLPFTGI